MNGLRAIVLVVMSLGLCGCLFGNAPLKHDPEYAPAYPAPLPPPGGVTGAIWQTRETLAFFEDVKPRRVGDMVTVRLVESMSGSKKAASAADKKQDTNIPGPTLFGRPVTNHGTEILETDLESSSSFEGEGDSSQSNTLSGSITVTVIEVLPNGYLRVRGEKRIGINQGNEYVQLSGIVRPVDIEPDNSVPSTQIADATIRYVGEGAIADANTMGWLARFFQSAFFPF